MYSVNDWSYVLNALSKSDCDKIIASAQNKWKSSAVQTIGQTDPRVSKAVRVSDIVWKYDRWIYELKTPYLRKINEESGWKYDIRSAESLQIARYRKGEFYNFHRDGRGDNLAANGGFVRKLSMTVLLNDGYEGGNFQFAQINNGKIKIDTPDFNGKQGSMVMFPSDMDHRITPVTKGTRYSLVVWFLGPPFK